MGVFVHMGEGLRRSLSGRSMYGAFTVLRSDTVLQTQSYRFWTVYFPWFRPCSIQSLLRKSVSCDGLGSTPVSVPDISDGSSPSAT